ncbi:MAG: ACT domain-containing protein [Spirochaetaceae bacterium]|jgi:ACT domain-containing protein|nr:ACT domain-containing protein [Spirochaetaceae bacterium]
MRDISEKKPDGAIITVTGTDHAGIIAKVSTFLAEHDVNIEDISQTILSGNFVMLMMVDLSKSASALESLKHELNEIGKSLNVSISMMHEKVFSAMHRI